jgi:cysteine-rich repeat protein
MSTKGIARCMMMGFVLLMALAILPSVANAQHTVGLSLSKTVNPGVQYEGGNVDVTVDMSNNDVDHGVINLTLENEAPWPGGTITDETATCGATALAPNGQAGDSTQCAFTEVATVVECLDTTGLPINPNTLVDQVRAAGEDAGVPGLPSTGSTTNLVTVLCCGDGILTTPQEECDPNDLSDPIVVAGLCNPDCTIAPVCGDGEVNQAFETCDPPGSLVAPVDGGDATRECRNTSTEYPACTYCGDGIVDTAAGEACDDGNDIDTDECSNTCQPNICDVSIVKETSCDGGATWGDGCSTLDSSQVMVRYRYENTGTNADLFSCTVDDTNTMIPDITTPFDLPDGSGEMTDVRADDQCSVLHSGGEPDTATITCDCFEAGSGITTTDNDDSDFDCLSCSVQIDKQVSCDDGATWQDVGFGDSVAESCTTDASATVQVRYVYENTGQVELVECSINDTNVALPGVTGPFTVAVGSGPIELDPDSGICSDIEPGEPDVATIDCECLEPGSGQSVSDSDDADVDCTTPAGACRMTGGHVAMAKVDSTFADPESGTHYSTGGQIGAPNESGCREYPQKGKCVDGFCTGGLRGGMECDVTDLDDTNDCPNDMGHNSSGPWGDWEHNHHSGPDDGYITGGSFSFHSGTAAAPDVAFINSVACADPGWCVQARPAPFKQIFWEGNGVFHNIKEGRSIAPLPVFPGCDVQVWDKKTGGTLHYYRAHVGDFGEPAGIRQKPDDNCPIFNECGTEPGGEVGIENCALTQEACLIPGTVNEEKSALYRAECEAQDCAECADWYEIEIHCTTDPASPVIYRVAHHITEGNFQLHPPVGDSCGLCGDGICDDLVDESCESCPEDCGPCVTIVPTSTSGTWGTR